MEYSKETKNIMKKTLTDTECTDLMNDIETMPIEGVTNVYKAIKIDNTHVSAF